MLDMNLSLQFPRLEFYSSSVLVKNKHEHGKIIGQKSKSVRLYKFNWKRFDEKKEADFWKWKKDHWPHASHLKYTPALSELYNELISNLTFALDQKYLHEIHHCARMALFERSRSRGFDTMIRDICLEPVDAYVYVAFRLLVDCIFDEEIKYYNRKSWITQVATHAMLFKFWHRQTGDGLLWRKSRMDRLSEVGSNSEYVCQFLDDIKSRLRLLSDSSTPTMEDYTTTCEDFTATCSLDRLSEVMYCGEYA